MSEFDSAGRFVQKGAPKSLSALPWRRGRSAPVYGGRMNLARFSGINCPLRFSWTWEDSIPLMPRD